jgi:hypothetical protein
MEEDEYEQELAEQFRVAMSTTTTKARISQPENGHLSITDYQMTVRKTVHGIKAKATVQKWAKCEFPNLRFFFFAN